MIYCPSCGTGNRDGSRFCNECGSKLPTMTSSLCPTCGTPNPPHSLFCEKCGTRLIASLAEEPETPETTAPAAVVPKGLSLPTKSTAGAEPAAAAPAPVEPQQPVEPAKPAEEELPDWMQVVQSAVAGTSELDIDKVTAVSSTSDEAAPEEIPAWLSDLGLGQQSGPLQKTPTDELLPEWAQRLRTIPEAEQPAAVEDEEVPDWLKTLGATGQLPSMMETPAAEETTSLAAATEPAAAEEELPEWLKEPTTPYFSTEPEAPSAPPAVPAPPAAEEMPDWLRDLRPAASTEDALPDWLDELGVEEQPASESMALSTGDSALDWLSQLGATAPESPTPAESAVTPDWMSSLRAAAPEIDTQPTEAIPDWLREVQAEQLPSEPTAADETPDWMSSLRATPIEPETPAEEEGAPEWLKGAGLAAAGAAAAGAQAEERPPEEVAPQKPITDWLSALRQATPEMEAEQAQAEEETPEWMREESGAAPQAIGGVPSYDQETPGWLREAGAAAEQPSAEEEIPEWLRATQAPIESAEAQAAMQPEEEGVPEWLKGLGAVAAGAALTEEEQPEEAAPQKPATDWLSALRQATPEMEAEQAQAEEEIPEWMREESGAAPRAIGEVQAYDQEVPDWLREVGAVPEQPIASAEEEIPEWLREAQAPVESVEVQTPTQPEEEGVPEWLKGLGAVAAGAALVEEQQPEEVVPQKPATDWLSALRRATPEMEAEQAAEEAEPEWLRDESGAAPQAIGGVPSYDQEVPDWLRETGAVTAPSAQVEEEGVPEWLREESGTAVAPAQPLAAHEAEKEEGVPEWLKGFGAAAVGAAAVAATPRAQEPSEEGLPDWLREAEPAPAITFETSEAEEAVPGETPEWLRELTPSAAVAGAAMAAAEPEVEEPEEAAEAEMEEEGEVSKAAQVAAAGLAAAAVVGAAKKPEQAAAAPTEMPEWLKEIRQEQQVARTAIPVPPPEATGLTQAEIPAWLEALRPTEEAAAPQEAETPSETEGPLAGIANALPAAPIMGEMTGLSAKLQFAISAEDQARAGVLKELLTQHAVAPASVEQFVVKGSAIRRRALRWLVTFLIAVALVVPVWFDLNQQTSFMLMPTATKMVVPPANMSAAVEIAKVAQLPPNSKVLFVFDYDASQSGELNRVATALLKSPALRHVQLEIASLNPQGSAMAQTVLKDFPDLRYTDRGFKPGQVSGVQSVLAEVGDVSLIVEVAASPETVRWWVEQLKANRDETPLVVGVSAGAESLTMPYLQSDQVKGLVSGFPGAVAYLNAAQLMNNYSQDQIDEYQIPLEGLTLANYVMAVLIVVGLIAALLRGTGRRSA